MAKKKALRFYIVLILAIIIFAIFHNSSKKPFEGLVHTATKPFSSFFSDAGRFTYNKFSFFSSIGTLKKDNSRLLEENLKLKSRIALLNDIKKENNELRKQIELAPRDSFKLKATMVIGRDMSGLSDSFIIDAGSNDGIKEQMAVVVSEGILIGKVKKALKTTSYVELIRSKNSRVNAEITESGAKGIVRGQYGTSVIIDMIPQTVEINKGDSIMTSGVGGILPRGLLVGYAQEPMSTADQLFQQASLILPVDYGSIRMVWIVTGTKNK
ncbi:MAG: rod shape-determining protein MreC [Patescibacteria group bacterium]|nr:rod shape-determining protein MreC [Patescibacteria group bacterium]